MALREFFDIIYNDEDEKLRSLIHGQTLGEKEIQAILSYSFEFGATKILCMLPEYIDVFQYLTQHGRNFTDSLLCKAIVNRQLHVVTQILSESNRDAVTKGVANSGGPDIFQKVLNTCVISVCSLEDAQWDEPDITDEQRIEALNALFSFGASPNEINKTDMYNWCWSDIICILGKRSPTLIGYLVDRKQFGPNLFFDPPEERTIRFRKSLLFIAISSNNLPLVKLLVKKGADIQQVDLEGETILHRNLDAEMLEFFLQVFQKRGLSQHMFSVRGATRNETPLEVAIKRRGRDIHKLYYCGGSNSDMERAIERDQRIITIWNAYGANISSDTSTFTVKK